MIGKVAFTIGALLWVVTSIDYLVGKPTGVSDWLEFAGGRVAVMGLMIIGIGINNLFERK